MYPTYMCMPQNPKVMASTLSKALLVIGTLCRKKVGLKAKQDKTGTVVLIQPFSESIKSSKKFWIKTTAVLVLASISPFSTQKQAY